MSTSQAPATSAASPTTAPHVLRDDDGEYFDEDVTFGFGTKPDTSASATWQPMGSGGTGKASRSDEQLTAFLKSRLSAKGGVARTHTHGFLGVSIAAAALNRTMMQTLTLASYDPSSDPFRNLTEELTLYNKLKFIFPGLILLPIRLIGTLLCIFTAALIMWTATLGLKLSAKDAKPLSGWRQAIASRIGYCGRALLFCLGFHRIVVKGTPATRTAAPIVVANHAAPWEAFALMYHSRVTFVSRAENGKIPFFGIILRGLQTIMVDRANASSRDYVVNEIIRRAHDDRWPPLGIFPEGTTLNAKSLLIFRNGAFQPGLPVQPVIVRYPYKHLDPTWSGLRLGLGTMVLRLMTQFYNSMELEYLPVYVPSDAEKRNADLYALNVRKFMSQHGKLQESPYSIEDYMVLLEASRFGIGREDAVLGMHAVRSSVSLTVSDVKTIMANFNKMDVSRSGKVTFPDFIKAMSMPDTPAMRTAFIRIALTELDAAGDMADKENADVLEHAQRALERGSLEINFRRFLQSVVHTSRNISTEEAVKMAFDIVNVKGDGKLVLEELEAIMAIADPDMPPSQVRELFRRIDVRRVGYVDIIEFGSFIRQNPAYMQLFRSVQESQRALGSNAVLDMLAARAAGTAMSVEEFKDRVRMYQSQQQQQQ